MVRVLLVDDEPNMRWVLQEALSKAGYETIAAASGEEALHLLAGTAVDLIILDLKLKGMDGLQTLRRIHTRWPAVVVIILTAYATVTTAVEAMQAGASDYLRKPFDVEEILFKIGRSLERRALQQEVQRLRMQAPAGLPGSAAPWRRAQEAAGESLALGMDVLLLGEPGSGRTSIARVAHQGSLRRDAPLVVLDLATLPGAVQNTALLGGDGREGLWSAAGQGTLLLRHVEHLHPGAADILGQLLVRRREQGVGPRLICTGIDAADQPMQLQHSAIVYVPPLRDHPDDIALFTAAWLPDQVVTSTALSLLTAYHWPDNLRELRAVLERAAILAHNTAIDEIHLPERIRTAPLPNSPLRLPPEGLSLEALEITLMKQALARAGGNKSRAAELLGLTRHTLLYRLEKYHIAEDG